MREGEPYWVPFLAQGELVLSPKQSIVYLDTGLWLTLTVYIGYRMVQVRRTCSYMGMIRSHYA